MAESSNTTASSAQHRSSSPDEVTGAVRGATTAGTAAPAVVRDFARAENLRLTALVESLSAKLVDCEGEDHDWMVALTDRADLTIEATSTSVASDRWSSDPGRRYLRAQRDAVDRGVRIRRLFVIGEPGDHTPELHQLCDDQQSLGIEVRVLARTELPSVAGTVEIRDRVVFDEALSYEIVSDPRPDNAGATIDLRSQRVSQHVRQFRTLWEAGR
ncbi:hypothetical protein V2S66_13820 [Streptomyces sp. V4-01]|uniref:DUF6879 domain-containing protein n=1 Tax=Actinacidiphila polyblastidii TaxID=3110430 RepID=A0ABU7PB42_9ACTN|nr:hypothetical protein [Streptomyces sp. V4-01]